MDQSPQLLQQQQLKVTPKQIAANYILQLSSLELQEVIEQELVENPALDMTEIPVCPLCGSELTTRVCQNCFGTTGWSMAREESGLEPLEGTNLLARDEEDDELDPIVRAESGQSLSDYLMWNLRAILPRGQHPVAEYLVGNLDEGGYLRVTVEEAARVTHSAPEAVQRTLAALQSIEPSGIGARDTRECLLIQLDQLEQEGVTHPYARAVITEHYQELGAHRFGEIAQALRIGRDDVRDALEFIKANLNPYPAHSFAAGPEGAVGAREAALRPDVIVRKDESGEYEVEVIESRRFVLRVNPVYRDLVAQRQAGSGVHLDDKDRQHVREYVTRAKFFIDNIHQRRRTIRRITETIVECQREFLENGVRSLRPLTRAEVAERIGMHESTVSRATAGKFVMLPDRHVAPFSMFFTASLGTKDVIRNLIAEEDSGRPLSDREIASQLGAQGIPLARRTVAKYRDEMKILPARLRRRA